ncbi:tail fiber assembly protein [Candidatus Erwinia dacicola]
MIPFAYSQEELQQQARDERDRLLSKAREKIVVPQTKLMVGRTLTETQLNELNAWLDYIDELEAADISALPVSFPEAPE